MQRLKFHLPTFGIFVLLGLLSFSGSLEFFQNKSLDFLFRSKGESFQSPEVVVVNISQDAVEEFGNWPFPRHIHGMFVDAVFNLGVHSVVYDVSFSHQTVARSDSFLVEMVRESKIVHLPLGFSPYPDALPITETQNKPVYAKGFPCNENATGAWDMQGILAKPLRGLAQGVASLGFSNLQMDGDGMVRRTPLVVRVGKRCFPQLAFSVWAQKNKIHLRELSYQKEGVYRGKERLIPLDGEGRMVIHWPGKWTQYPHYSFREILLSYKQIMEGLPPILSLEELRALQNKILIIGHTDPSSGDYIAQPLENYHPVTGLQYSILQTLLNKSAILHFKQWEVTMITFLILLLCSLLLQREELYMQFVVLFVAGLWVGVAFLSFRIAFYFFPVVEPVLGILLLLIFQNIRIFLEERKNKKRVQNIFAKYVTTEVMNELLQKPELTQLGGHKEVVTILFSDIRGFTSLSESLEPGAILTQLNEYLEAMTPLIFKNQGIIDKLVGDEIMAYYGAPVYPDKHAQRAFDTAVEMQVVLQKLRKKWQVEGKPDIQIGVGINTGAVVMGNVGSSQYMDFTLIGDNVNLGARLCGNARAGEILVSESTFYRLERPPIYSEPRELKVKGKSRLVKVHGVLVDEKGIVNGPIE